MAQITAHATATAALQLRYTLVAGLVAGLDDQLCWPSIKLLPILARSMRDPQRFLLLLNHRSGRRHGARGTEHGWAWSWGWAGHRAALTRCRCAGRYPRLAEQWRREASLQCLVQHHMGNGQGRTRSNDGLSTQQSRGFHCILQPFVAVSASSAAQHPLASALL